MTPLASYCLPFSGIKYQTSLLTDTKVSLLRKRREEKGDQRPDNICNGIVVNLPRSHESVSVGDAPVSSPGGGRCPLVTATPGGVAGERGRLPPRVEDRVAVPRRERLAPPPLRPHDRGCFFLVEIQRYPPLVRLPPLLPPAVAARGPLRRHLGRRRRLLRGRGSLDLLCFRPVVVEEAARDLPDGLQEQVQATVASAASAAAAAGGESGGGSGPRFRSAASVRFLLFCRSLFLGVVFCGLVAALSSVLLLGIAFALRALLRSQSVAAASDGHRGRQRALGRRSRHSYGGHLLHGPHVAAGLRRRGGVYDATLLRGAISLGRSSSNLRRQAQPELQIDAETKLPRGRRRPTRRLGIAAMAEGVCLGKARRNGGDDGYDLGQGSLCFRRADGRQSGGEGVRWAVDRRRRSHQEN
ncbi:unnamed protein product [Musa acuminata subsp. burmannicoides]